jgi:hypothetical protein
MLELLYINPYTGGGGEYNMEDQPALWNAIDPQDTAKALADIIKKNYALFLANDFLVTNRAVPNAFAKVYKDAVASYSEDVLLCERFFKSSACKDGTRPVHSLTPEQTALYQEFNDFITNETLKQEMGEGEYARATEGFIERLNAMVPEITEVPVRLFTLPDGFEILVEAVKDASPDGIAVLCERASALVLTYFMAVNFIYGDPYSFTVFPVEYPNYTDLLVKFSIAG